MYLGCALACVRAVRWLVLPRARATRENAGNREEKQCSLEGQTSREHYKNKRRRADVTQPQRGENIKISDEPDPIRARGRRRMKASAAAENENGPKQTSTFPAPSRKGHRVCNQQRFLYPLTGTPRHQRTHLTRELVIGSQNSGLDFALSHCSGDMPFPPDFQSTLLPPPPLARTSRFCVALPAPIVERSSSLPPKPSPPSRPMITCRRSLPSGALPPLRCCSGERLRLWLWLRLWLRLRLSSDHRLLPPSPPRSAPR